jgi:multidrug resistance efflux pump
VVVAGRVVEVTPNVNGQVVSIPVATNVPVKKGAVLFEIDPTPFQYKVKQLEAALASAQQQAEQLKANYDQATANVHGLAGQLEFHSKRLADMQTLVTAQAATEFREQDTQNQVETTRFQLAAAEAAQVNAKIALDAQAEGVNPTVAQVAAQLDDAKWELSQTKIVAPGDGYVTVMALAVGDRAVQLRPALAFILTDEITIVGLFSPNGFQTIKVGDAGDARLRQQSGQTLPGQDHGGPARRRAGPDRHLGHAGAPPPDRRHEGISGDDFDSRRRRPRPSPPWHARYRDGVQ